MVKFKSAWARNLSWALLLACQLCLARPVVVFMSDFGLENEAVGLCHGAMLSINSDLQIVDLTHQVRPYDIEQGARILARATTFPAGTVFVAVIDPGVGTARAPIVLKTRSGYYYIAPNNGLLTEVARRQGIAAVCRIEPERVNRKWKPGTFDGRDLFAPAAARLASSGGKLEELGETLKESDVIRLELPGAKVDRQSGCIIGKYIRTDEPYGNIWTNIEQEELTSLAMEPGAMLEVKMGGHEQTVPFVRAFGDVPEKAPLAYINSDERLALALNMGNLRKAWNLQEGMEIKVRIAIAKRTDKPQKAALK